jgi:hypothetical protein
VVVVVFMRDDIWLPAKVEHMIQDRSVTEVGTEDTRWKHYTCPK